MFTLAVTLINFENKSQNNVNYIPKNINIKFNNPFINNISNKLIIHDKIINFHGKN